MGNVSFRKFLTLLMVIAAVTLQQAEPTTGVIGDIFDTVFGRRDDPITKVTPCIALGNPCSSKWDCCGGLALTVCAKVNDDSSEKTCNIGSNIPVIPSCSLYGNSCSTDKDCCSPPLYCTKANDATNKTCDYKLK